MISNFKFQISNLRGGYTVVEVAVSAGIFIVLATIISQVYFLIISQVVAYREQTAISALADHYMEVARNLAYSQLGTLSGNPHGNLADSVTPINTTINGVPYQIYYVVNYFDDPADGQISLGTDFAANDYKQIKLYVKNVRKNTTNSFLTNVAPNGLEGLASGGALSIQVFDSVGQPVSGASVRIQNSSLNPSIDLTRQSDAQGKWIEVGLPNSTNGYHVTVTKNGFSTDQTYPISVQNPNPAKPDSTISNGQVTQVSFSIDALSSLSFIIKDSICSPVSGVGLAVQGAKLIGTPNVLKFDQAYVSDGSGQVPLSNIEWDTYTPALSSTSYMVYGSSPIQQVSILPATSQSFSLIIGPKTTNSLLVIVKDASNGNAIEAASVRLQSNSPTFDSTELTAGSIWSQQDWSSGSGQVNFTNPQKYFDDSGTVDANQIPLALRLSQVAGNYSSTGFLTSSTFDTGTGATAYTTLEWQPASQDPSTALKFQVATNNDNETWNFKGPDGAANSFYTVSGTTMPATQSNARYVRYRAFLSTSDTLKTPVLTSLNLNYVSGCFTPGQSMFSGLSQGSNYSVSVSATGYQAQTVNPVNISGYNVLTVLMTQ